VCPDLDSVTYALAGANNPETGWGVTRGALAPPGARPGIDSRRCRPLPSRR